MKFRYDINALRAIAVLGVVLFHYKVPYFSGGFSGVDVFFVISGYLMSRIIMDSLDNGTFSIIDFYQKRFKRIVPALLFLIFIVLVFCFFVYLPVDYRTNTKNAASSITFVSNFLYWKNSDYFDASSDSNLFLHTWSLSLEWQFYLIYPLLLWTGYKLFKKRGIFFGVFTLFTVLSCLLCLFLAKDHANFSFYLLPTRAWELLAGGIAYQLSYLNLKKARFSLNFISPVCYGLIILCFVFIDDEMTWPGVFTIFPVVLTMLVIMANYNDSWLFKSKLVQFIGRISYSWYLWHWPLYVILQELGYGENILSTIILIPLSAGIAFISHKFIELPAWKNTKPIILLSVLLLGLTLTITFFSFNDVLFEKQTIRISNYQNESRYDRILQFNNKCFVTSFESGMKDFDKSGCLQFNKGKNNILLVGDSHAAQFYQSFQKILDKSNISLSQATASGCLPIIKKNGRNNCSEVMDYIFHDYILNYANEISGVIISANWLRGKDNPVELVNDLKATIKYIEGQGIDVVVIGQNETYTVSYTSIAAKEYQYRKPIRNKYINRNSFEMNEYLKTSLPKYYIDIYDVVDSQRMSSDHIPYMFDLDHFTKYGADIVAQKIFTNKLMAELLSR